VTVTHVSSTPTNLATGVDPSAYVVHEFSKTEPGDWDLGSPPAIAGTSWSFTSGTGPLTGLTDPLASNVISSGWDVVQEVDGGTGNLRVKIRPIGGWPANSEIGPSYGGPVGLLGVIDVWTEDGGNAQDFTGPQFTTGDPADEWIYAELSDDELIAVEEDRPLISWRSCLAGSDASWSAAGTLSTLVPEDENDLYRKPTRLVDEVGDTPSRPFDHSATLHVLFDIAESVTFDMVAILGHNFARLTDLTEVTLEIADDEDFTTHLQEIATWTDDFERRLVCVLLGKGLHAEVTSTGARYTARFVRLRIEYDGSDLMPEIGEIFLARRWTPPSQPSLPLALDAETGARSEWESVSGDTTRVHANAGRTSVETAWPLVSDVELDDARAWGESIGYGAYPCVVVPYPGSAPNLARLVRVADVFETPQAGPAHETIEVSALELAPFVSSEDS
jgi:hypothetical protein